LDAIVAVLLPWLAGHSTFGAPTPASSALAVLASLAYAAASWANAPWGRALLVVSYLGVISVLIATGEPLAAGGVLVLLLPQIAVAPWRRPGYPARALERFSRPWTLVAMALAALAV
jgi:hypothetical protein